MDSKIKELTEKIYHEGVEKGNQQAAEILAQAKSQSEEILAKAKADAERILSDANRSAAEHRKNSEAELKLYADQTVSSIKSAVADSITDKIAQSNVQAMATDPEFMKRLMMTIVSKWTPGEALVLETEDAKNLEQYMLGNAKDLLESGKLTIKEVNGKGANFSIAPANGAYKIDFGEQEFVNFFKSFLRPRLVETLF